MKKTRFALLSICMLTTVAMADQTEKPIIVKKTAPNFVLTLKSNPTTGYSWFLVKQNKMIQATKREYIAPTKAMPGASGEEKWFFTIKPEAFVVPRIITIKLLYARPWDLADANPKTFPIITTNR